MLIPSTITARRTRRYTSTLYIPGTIQRIGYYPMDDGGRYSFQPPNVSNLSAHAAQYISAAYTHQWQMVDFIGKEESFLNSSEYCR